jgi:hypothetical protein
LSSDPPPDARRGEKAIANPIAAIKGTRPTRHRVTILNRPDIFSSCE